MIVILIQMASSLTVSMIPTTGTPPERLGSAESVYDPIENRIISFGGLKSDNTYTSSISYFSLSTKTWTFPIYESLISPPGLVSSKLALRKDRKLLVFFGSKESGLSSSVYSYNLETDSWSIETLSGDVISGLTNYASDLFTYNNTQYISIFGGIGKNGASNELYFIDINTLNVKHMPKAGTVPLPRLYTSLIYYNERLYVFGGRMKTPDNLTQEVFEYQIESKQWRILPVIGSKPSSRFAHSATLYKDSMYVIYGLEYHGVFKDIWQFNFTTFKWSLKHEDSLNYRFFCSVIRINSTLYLLFGRNITNVFNSIDLYDLSGTSFQAIKLSDDWDFPPARKDHCSLVISDKMYLFGGLSHTGEYLNDLWTYDISLNKWTQIEASGDIPSPRASFSCIRVGGKQFVIIFGRDSSTAYNDLYLFDSFSNAWKKNSPTGSMPAPRFSACVCISNYYTFITGGQNSENAFDDFWIFDYYSNTFTQVNSTMPFKLLDHKCWVNSNEIGYDLYVIGGNTIDRVTNSFLYKISVTDLGSLAFTVESENIFKSDYITNSENELIVVDDTVILVLGIAYNSFITQSIVSLNYKTLQMKVADLTSVPGSYGHSAIHYKDSIYVFGGSLGVDTFKLYTAPVNRFLKISGSSHETSIEIGCSKGTIKPDCTPCPPGTYNNGTFCLLCPIGTFSTNIALNDVTQCIPCDFNSFSDTEGSTYCLDCPKNSFCPIGSSAFKGNTKLKPYQNTQPKVYSPITSIDETFNYVSWLGIICSAGLLSIILLSSTKIQNFIQKLDFFVDKHSQTLNKPVIYRKTTIGGCFSILFLITVAMIIALNILTFVQNNISETRSLVPISTVTEKVIADVFEIEVIYYYYGASCGQNGICPSHTKIVEVGIQYSLKTTQCQAVGNSCIVNIKYLDCSSSKESTISISQIDMSAYTTYMSVNISVASSIPKEFSNIFIPISPPSFGMLFKGRSPTILSFELTPTVISILDIQNRLK